jgi:hypothetical protein
MDQKRGISIDPYPNLKLNITTGEGQCIDKNLTQFWLICLSQFIGEEWK